MTYWAVAQTQPLRERLAVDELEQIGFRAYCPRIRYRYDRRWRSTALFPSYVFLQITSEWYRARWCRGVIRLLGTDGCPPYRLGDNVIAEIKSRERDGFVVLKSPPKLKRGQQVRIIGG